MVKLSNVIIRQKVSLKPLQKAQYHIGKVKHVYTHTHFLGIHMSAKLFFKK